VGDHIVEAVAGDLVVKPRGIPHAFWNASEAPARIVELIVPAGFEGYFRQMAPVLAAPQPDFGCAAESCARYGIQMDTDSIGVLHARFGLVGPT
jgi:hypothetical protein